MAHWRCISGCGACCRLDPALRGEDLESLDAQQRRTYLAMVGADGWCIHFDTGARRCRIYDSRPDFCRVENLVALFGSGGRGESGPCHADGDADGDGDCKADKTAGAGVGAQAEGDALAIACCRRQIRAEYGGRGKVMRRFERAIRRQP